MNRLLLCTAALTAHAAVQAAPESVSSPFAVANDPRVRTVMYAPDSVVSVPVQRGQVTHIVLSDDETLVTAPGTGKGADCSKEADTWCITALGRDIFVKPKTGATTNNMVLVTSRRRHAFEFAVVPERSNVKPLMRLTVTVPRPAPAVVLAAPSGPPPLSAAQLIENRMRHEPAVRNAEYSVATGDRSEDLVPVMVFDNGTQTYFSFPNNRPLPAIFESLADGSEEMVNVRLDSSSGFMVADRVARRFVLRLGNAVAAIINDRFDIDGVPPDNGTTVPGVTRTVRAAAAATQRTAR